MRSREPPSRVASAPEANSPECHSQPAAGTRSHGALIMKRTEKHTRTARLCVRDTLACTPTDKQTDTRTVGELESRLNNISSAPVSYCTTHVSIEIPSEICLLKMCTCSLFTQRGRDLGAVVPHAEWNNNMIMMEAIINNFPWTKTTTKNNQEKLEWYLRHSFSRGACNVINWSGSPILQQGWARTFLIMIPSYPYIFFAPSFPFRLPPCTISSLSETHSERNKHKSQAGLSSSLQKIYPAWLYMSAGYTCWPRQY